MTELRKCISSDLTSQEISAIRTQLHTQELRDMTDSEFIPTFAKYDFYLLYDNKELVSLLRIFNDFSFRVGTVTYEIPELVGLVSIVQGKGYGKTILAHLKSDLIANNRECIGYCFAHNRGFYEKCGVEVFENSAKYFLEQDKNGVWVPSEDDDVLNINLSEASRQLILGLSVENPARIIDTVANQATPLVCAVPN